MRRFIKRQYIGWRRFYRDMTRIMDFFLPKQIPYGRKILHVLLFPLLMMFFGFVIMAIKSVLSSHNNSPARKYPADKYRRVIKEGVFWDSTEYHER